MDHVSTWNLKQKESLWFRISDHWVYSILMVMDDSPIDSFTSTFCQIFTRSPTRAKSAREHCYSSFNLLYENIPVGKGTKHYLFTTWRCRIKYIDSSRAHILCYMSSIFHLRWKLKRYHDISSTQPVATVSLLKKIFICFFNLFSFSKSKLSLD